MVRVLKVIFPEKCIGCELCVIEAQRQLGKVGLEGSLIRVLRDETELGLPVISVDIDPKISDLDLEKISKICPTGVFTVEEVLEEEHGLTD